MASDTINQQSSSNKFTWKWKIDNFSKINSHSGLFSEVFTFDGFKWKVYIYPKGQGKVYDHLSLFLHPVELTEPVNVKFSIAACQPYRHQPKHKLETKHTFQPKIGFGWTYFMRLKDLHDPDFGYLVNDSFVVEVEMTHRLEEDPDEDSSGRCTLDSVVGLFKSFFSYEKIKKVD